MQEFARTIVIIAIPFLVVAIFMAMLARGSAEVRAFYARTYNRLPSVIQTFLVVLLAIGVICMILYMFVGSLIVGILHGAVWLFGSLEFGSCVISTVKIDISTRLILTCEGSRIWIPIYFAS